MRTYFLVGALILTSLVSAPVASASCMDKPSIEDSAKASAVVFVGTVTKITPAQAAGAGYPLKIDLSNRGRSTDKLVKPPNWQRYDRTVDVVSFALSEAFKGVSSATIDITTGADGFAGYTFQGGTWLKEGQTYLVYATERLAIGTVPDSTADASERLAFNREVPKELAAEINEVNSHISPYVSNVCMRTTDITTATEDLEQLRRLFPEAKRFSTQATARQTTQREAQPATFLQRLLSFFGLG